MQLLGRPQRPSWLRLCGNAWCLGVPRLLFDLGKLFVGICICEQRLWQIYVFCRPYDLLWNDLLMWFELLPIFAKRSDKYPQPYMYTIDLLPVRIVTYNTRRSVGTRRNDQERSLLRPETPPRQNHFFGYLVNKRMKVNPLEKSSAASFSVLRKPFYLFSPSLRRCARTITTLSPDKWEEICQEASTTMRCRLRMASCSHQEGACKGPGGPGKT